VARVDILPGVLLRSQGGRRFKPTDFRVLYWFYKASSYAGRRINFAPVKSLDSSDSDSEFSLFEFRFTLFFPLGCGADS